MTCSASEYLSAVKWAEESFAPKDFAKTTLLPQVGKIIKGQFQEQGLGVPTTACPSLNQTIFWTRVVKRVKVIAQCVKFKDLKGGSLPRSIAFGPRLEIYDDYNGWFEILSEDGRSVKVMESISEVAKRMPRKFLIREAIKVNLGKKVDEEEFLSEKTRVIPSGEVLSLATIGSFCSKNPSDKYLKCFTSEGERNCDDQECFPSLLPLIASLHCLSLLSAIIIIMCCYVFCLLCCKQMNLIFLVIVISLCKHTSHIR